MKASFRMAMRCLPLWWFQLHHQISQWDFSLFHQPNAINSCNSPFNRCSFYSILWSGHFLVSSMQFFGNFFLSWNSSPIFRLWISETWHKVVSMSKVQVKLVFWAKNVTETSFAWHKDNVHEEISYWPRYSLETISGMSMVEHWRVETKKNWHLLANDHQWWPETSTHENSKIHALNYETWRYSLIIPFTIRSLEFELFEQHVFFSTCRSVYVCVAN